MNKQIKENSLSIVLAVGVEMEFVRVPAGKFLMGSDKNKDPEADDNELPQHEVYLNEYWMGKYPVTVSQFAAYINISNYRTRAEQKGSGWVYNGSEWEEVNGADWRHPSGPGSDIELELDFPVTRISWHDAWAFCRWVSQTSGRTIRLPSEAEWEKAARGTDGRIYPWGNEDADASYCNFNENIGDTTVVGKYSPKGDSIYNCADMSGNVWEWTRSLWGKDESKCAYSYPYNSVDGRENEDAEDDIPRVLRGGSFGFDLRSVRSTFRFWGNPLNCFNFYGFRAVVVPLPKLQAFVETPRVVTTLAKSSGRQIENSLIIPLAPDLEMEFMRVPAGKFLMGSDKSKDPVAFDNELPQHEVYLDEYWMGKYPVTNAQYEVFVKAKGHEQQYQITSGKENHPVVYVSWDDARAFCDWVSRVSEQKICLPSEAEWEKAARGTDGRKNPWGNHEADASYCTFNKLFEDTTNVGKCSPKGDSPYNCADMSGNVWEWTRSLLKPYPYKPGDGRENMDNSADRVLRGGSFDNDHGFVRCASRLGISPRYGNHYFGFRAVVVPF